MKHEKSVSDSQNFQNASLVETQIILVLECCSKNANFLMKSEHFARLRPQALFGSNLGELSRIASLLFQAEFFHFQLLGLQLSVFQKRADIEGW